MNEAIIEFFVLGEIPGTNITVGYRTSLAIAGLLVVAISLYATLRYKNYVTDRIANMGPEKLVDLKTI